MLGLIAAVLQVWPARAGTTLHGGGSSLAGLIWDRWTTRYKMVESGVNATYIATSSGKGVQDLTTKTDQGKFLLDWAGTDFWLQEETYKAFPGIQQIPILAVTVAIVIFIPGIHSGDLALDVDTAALLFAGNITHWDHPRILALNPSEDIQQSLRGLAVKTKVRTGQSGTTEILTRYLAQSPYWPYGVFSKWPTEVPHERIEGTNALLGYMQTLPGSLSYAPLPLVASTENTYVSLRTSSGVLVQPTKEYVSEKLYNMQLDNRLHATLVLSNATYPITDMTYYVFQWKDTGRTCKQSRELMRFLRFVIVHDSARAYAEHLGYVPLPLDSAAYATIMDTLLNVTCPGEKEPMLSLVFHVDDSNKWSPMRIALCCVAVVLCIVCYFLGILVFRMHWISYSDRSTGLAFSLVSIAGFVTACISVFFWVLIPTRDWVCVCRVLFSLLALTLILGGLVAQTWVIWDLLNAKASGIKQLEALASMYFGRRMGLVLFPQLTLAIVWLTVDTPTTAEVVLNDVSRQAIHECKIDHGMVWFGVEVVWFIVLALLGMWMALRNRRRFPTRGTNKESNTIFSALERLLTCLLFCVAVLLTESPGTNVFIFAVCCALLVPTALSLLTVMIPKVEAYRVFKSKERFIASFRSGSQAGSDSSAATGTSHPAGQALRMSRQTSGRRASSERNIIAGIDCGSFVFLGDGGVFEDHHYELKAQPDVSGDDVDIIQVDSKVPLVSALHHAHPTVTTVTLPDVVDFHHLAPHEYINMIMRNKKQQQQTSSAPLGQATIPVKKHVSFDLSPSPATEHEQQSRNSSTPPGTELEQQQSRSSSTPPGTELEQQQSRNSSTPPGTESSSTPPGTEQEQQQQVEVDNSEAHVDVHVVPGPHVDVHVVPGSLVVPGPHVDVHVVPGPHVDVHVLAGPAAPEAGQS